MTVRLGMLPQFSFSSGKVVSILNLREGKQLPFILVQNYLQMWFKWESYLFSSLISVSNWNQRRDWWRCSRHRSRIRRKVLLSKSRSSQRHKTFQWTFEVTKRLFLPATDSNSNQVALLWNILLLSDSCQILRTQSLILLSQTSTGPWSLSRADDPALESSAWRKYANHHDQACVTNGRFLV